MNRVDFDFTATGLSTNNIELLVPVQTIGAISVVRLFVATLQQDANLPLKSYFVVFNTLSTFVQVNKNTSATLTQTFSIKNYQLRLRIQPSPQTGQIVNFKK